MIFIPEHRFRIGRRNGLNGIGVSQPDLNEFPLGGVADLVYFKTIEGGIHMNPFRGKPYRHGATLFFSLMAAFGAWARGEQRKP